MTITGRGSVVVVVVGTVGGVVFGLGPGPPQTGAPPIPHRPSAVSAALTGPEIRRAFTTAAMGRRMLTATVRRRPIWPALAESYSWFASTNSQIKKQSTPTPRILPAEARRRLSVGAPSAARRAGVLVREGSGGREGSCPRAARCKAWARVGLALAARSARSARSALAARAALAARSGRSGRSARSARGRPTRADRSLLDLSEVKNRRGGASRHPEKSGSFESPETRGWAARDREVGAVPGRRGGRRLERSGSEGAGSDERDARGAASCDRAPSAAPGARAEVRLGLSLSGRAWLSSLALRLGSRPEDLRPSPKLVKKLVPPSTRSCPLKTGNR